MQQQPAERLHRGPASYEQLCRLHRSVCQRLIEYLSGPGPVRAAYLDCAIMFLRHNSIAVDPSTKPVTAALESLMMSLPVFPPFETDDDK